MQIKEIEMAADGDFPGQRALRLYAAGCNLRCPYCAHARELCEDHGDGKDWADVEAVIKRRRARIDGVILSGGEPTIHDDLEEWILRLRALELKVMLETNGLRPEVIRPLLARDLLDYVAMDVKAPIANYAAVTGVRIDAEPLRTSVWLIRQSGVPHEFRTTAVPGLHTLRELKGVVELVHGAQKYVIQDFISTDPLSAELRGRPAFPHKSLEDMRKFVERRVENYEIRSFEAAKPMPILKRRIRRSVYAS